MDSLFSCFNSVVEFKDEEFVKKAILTMNKHDLNGRPLNIKEVGTNHSWMVYSKIENVDYYFLVSFFKTSLLVLASKSK